MELWGTELVSLLSKRALPVRAATRHPEKLRTAGNVETVQFDFELSETFAPSLEGVDQVFLMARPGDDYADQFSLPFIDEMKRQGIQHVVNLSALGAERRDDFALSKIEHYLEDSHIPFTHLRPNFFMQIFSATSICADIKATGAMHIPAGDARLSFIDARDIAQVALEALCDPTHRGKAYDLTGGEALSHQDVAEKLSRATGRDLRYVPLTEEHSRRALTAVGLSSARIERLIGFYQLVRAGMCEPVSPDVSVVLGRSPKAFDSFAAEFANCWSD